MLFMPCQTFFCEKEEILYKNTKKPVVLNITLQAVCFIKLFIDGLFFTGRYLSSFVFVEYKKASPMADCCFEKRSEKNPVLRFGTGQRFGKTPVNSIIIRFLG